MLTSRQRSLLISSSGGFFIWGIVASMAPLSLSWPFVNGSDPLVRVLVLSAGPAGLLAGNFIMGLLSDAFGRRRIFIATMAMYGIGIVLISIATTFPLLLAGVVVSSFGVGGEEAPSLALIAEDVPVKQRGRLLTLIPNFNNIGSAFAAAFFLFSVSGAVFIERAYLLVSSLAIMALLVFTRMKMPESFRWLHSRGREEDAENEKSGLNIGPEGESVSLPPLWKSYILLSVLGVSQFLTFGLMAFVLGPDEFPSQTALIIFVALAGASISGFVAAPLVSRGRRSYTLISFGGGFVTIVAILIAFNSLSNEYVFLPLLFLNMAFSEFAWAARTTLEPELFPTAIRGTGIGLVRVVPIIAYIASIVLLSNTGLFDFVLINVILWGVGLAAATYWYFRGVETSNISPDFKGADNV